MFNVWKLKWRLRKVSWTTAREKKKLRERNADRSEFQELEWSEQEAVKDLEQGLDYIEGTRLYRLARKLDVEVPPITDAEIWVDDTGESGYAWFTSKGRSLIGKQIDEVRARRFEVKTLWVTKIIIPLGSLLIAFLGLLVGMIALSRRNAPEPEKKPPTFERLLKADAQIPR
jgi:hypothetical protein